VEPYSIHIENKLVQENTFWHKKPDSAALPTFEQGKAVLPRPFWEGHEPVIDCYWKAWELAFRSLRQPTPENGFVSNYIDTAFNNNLFMWDSVFILLFARYGSRAFHFQGTLDNLYCKQHPDGFICREIRESDGSDCFERFDPSSTGPNVFAWAEWEYFNVSGDRERLARAFPVILSYHRWLRAYRTWPDGTYWSSGWGCGMDNQPRQAPAAPYWHSEHWINWHHGHISWIDACLQQFFSAALLTRMAEILGRTGEIGDLGEEVARLGTTINTQMWDERTAFYYDRTAEGSLNGVKIVGAYWALLAGLVPQYRLEAFIGHLKDPKEFNRTHRVPSLSADHPKYSADGEYWRGAVWPPTNYMVLRGLTSCGDDDLAHEIAQNHLDQVVQVFQDTGTLWENYAPEKAAQGIPAKKDFVGWSGLPPVAVLFEYIFGLRPDVPKNRLVWDIRLLEEHGVERYPFGKDGLLSLKCKARKSDKENPVLDVKSNQPLELVVRWGGGQEIVAIKPEP